MVKDKTREETLDLMLSLAESNDNISSVESTDIGIRLEYRRDLYRRTVVVFDGPRDDDGNYLWTKPVDQYEVVSGGFIAVAK